MKAAVVEEIANPLVVHRDWPDPDCGPDEAVIRVEANGICRSDYYVWQGGWPWLGIALSVPFVLGHEYCGVVEEGGSAVTRIHRGDRVVVPFNHSCGRCEPCQAGHQNVCADLRLPMLNYTGGFGRYTKVARADVNVVPLPDSISYVEAAALGCRFMTAWRCRGSGSGRGGRVGGRVWVWRRRPGVCGYLYGSGCKCDRGLAHRRETGARERTRGRAHGQRIRGQTGRAGIGADRWWRPRVNRRVG
jgi:D-arabinose 1-dehydrogenase-like Zn-dependent alcohol dehydrogenase